ncbi:GNAT family N-acetyltransferase [Ekhidna sp.]|uniref:GNAT family N-acetyltransferase n=1 Tax=Ekhidna sp. TaxID=2608089 RepID=UPI003BA9EA02
MLLNIHNTFEEVPDNLSLAYFQKGYFRSQSYSTFKSYCSEDFFIPFDITPEKAISIPRSPFGSFFCRSNEIKDAQYFIERVKDDLIKHGVNNIEIIHPSSIYHSFISGEIIQSTGFNIEFEDINQHIDLSEDWEESIHTMQKRKLDALQSEGFEFRKMEKNEFETAHKFLSVCRQAQGLQINISWEHLNNLIMELPDAYECFGVFREDKISALCITVNVTTDIAYYYLPATSPMFRDKSPMVLLISGLVSYYRSKGFKQLDMGVSSFQGKPQETLRIFKERMGAKETVKPTFKLVL